MDAELKNKVKSDLDQFLKSNRKGLNEWNIPFEYVVAKGFIEGLDGLQYKGAKGFFEYNCAESLVEGMDHFDCDDEHGFTEGIDETGHNRRSCPNKETRATFDDITLPNISEMDMYQANYNNSYSTLVVSIIYVVQ
ncbi:hypothetical protein JHK86_049940 [Glycine max]|nr:hypothetical protein JHK86_049940 [Glycine max]